MAVDRIAYMAGGLACNGALVWDEKTSAPRPLLLMAPNWLGVTDDAIKRTQMMAGDRYIGFVADMYGGGKTVSGPPESAALSDAVKAIPGERRRRIVAALDTLTSESRKRGIGDPNRRAAVGFCFGGGNVLELARSGASVQAAVCLHGDLTTPRPATPGSIRSAILVLHGAKDPVAPKAERDALEAEMDAAGAHWQMLTFGGLVHSFAEAEANVKGVAEYNAAAARQSYAMVDSFISDAFAGRL